MSEKILAILTAKPKTSIADMARATGVTTRTGVYVLVGPPEESGLPRVYVGEGDPIKPRLEQHTAAEDSGRR
jgi:hypothetical protein